MVWIAYDKHHDGKMIVLGNFLFAV